MNPDLGVSPAELRAEVEAFVYLEARLADESRYDDWLALFDDPTHYWVPAGPADYDPAMATKVSYVNDNRSRLETRVQQLGTGHRYAQTPPSPMRRVVSNLEILGTSAGGEGQELVEVELVEGALVDGALVDGALVEVASNFVLYELSAQATNEIRIWAGRTTHTLRRTDGGFLIRRKVVELVNASRPLPTLAFLL